MEKNVYDLRPLKPEDAARMLEWMQTEDVVHYLRLRGENMTLADTSAFIEKARDESVDLHRAVTMEDGRYYGTVSLKNIDRQAGEAEYAISLHPDAIGTGAARRATEGILRIAFRQLGLRRVYLNVAEENLRAIRFYEKFGFRYECSTPVELKGAHTKLRWYGIQADEFPLTQS